jgi:SpoIID/LytB domain protein
LIEKIGKISKGEGERVKKSLVYCWIFMLLAAAVMFPRPSHAEENSLSIKLLQYFKSVSELHVLLKGNWQIKNHPEIRVDSDAAYLLKTLDGSLVLMKDGESIGNFGPQFTLAPAPYSEENQISLNGHLYLGEITFTIENNQYIRPINKLPLDDYLKGVVPSEMPASWNLEALKAQAVAARTYVMTKLGAAIDDTVSYQAYNGFQWYPKSSQAVDQTAGQLLKYHGKLISAVFSSSNGGVTESSENVWGSEQTPYLPAQADNYDPKNPWTINLTKTQIDLADKDLKNPDLWWSSSVEKDKKVIDNMKAYLKSSGYANGDLKIVSIPEMAISPEKTTSGRSKKASIQIEFFVKDSGGYRIGPDGALQKFVFEKTDFPISGLRALLGPSLMKSYLVDPLQDTGDTYVLSGLGYGHGVGMSQWGAKVMGDQGITYNNILSFYYPGTDLIGAPSSNAGTPGLEEVVPSGNTGAPSPGKVVPSGDVNVPVPGKAVPTQETGNGGPAANEGDIRVVINGNLQNYNPAPLMQNDRVFVPMRAIFEALGATIKWDENTQTVKANKGATNVQLTIGLSNAKVNGEPIPLDVVAFTKQNRTMVPARFVSESLGADVKWDAGSNTVYIVAK